MIKNVVLSHSAPLLDPYCLISIPDACKKDVLIWVPSETIRKLSSIAYGKEKGSGIISEYAKTFLKWFEENMKSSETGFLGMEYAEGSVFSVVEDIIKKGFEPQILTVFDQEKIIAKNKGIALFTNISYDPEAVAKNVYRKFPKIETVDVETDIIDRIYNREAIVTPMDFGKTIYIPNQCYILKNGINVVLAIYNPFSKKIEQVPFSSEEDKKGFGPKNYEQCFADYCLRAKHIRGAIFFGESGSGKSYLPFRAGLDQVIVNGNGHKKIEIGYGFDEMYAFSKMIVFKGSDPESEIYPGIVPGDARQKIDYEAGSIRDILEVLSQDKDMTFVYGKKNNPEILEALEAENILKFESPAGITGRSFNRAFVFIDEGQLLSRKIMQTLIRRMGKGTKFVVSGDLLQMGVDGYRHDNGLTLLAEKLSHEPHFAFVPFTKSIRSITSEACSRAFSKMF